MAIKQLVPIEVTLVGDGTSTTFAFALANMYQNGTGSSFPFGTAGIVPTGINVPNPPTPVSSSSVDAFGNVTLVLTTAPGNNVQYTFELDLLYNSGAAVWASPNQVAASSIYAGTTPLRSDPQGDLRINPINVDVVGDAVSGTRWNQWQYDASTDASDTTLYNTNVKNTGTTSQSAGFITISTGTTTGSQLAFLSTTTVNIRLGHEWFLTMPGVVFGPTASGTSQRMGLYGGGIVAGIFTPSNGFFIGYEGTVFGITQFATGGGQGSYSSGSSPSIPQASMNGDPLTGATGSAFTSGGSPVAWVPTNQNTYRIRGMWASGPVVLEILSPDGFWVVMHTYRLPNASVNLSSNSAAWTFVAAVAGGSATPTTLSFAGASFGSTDPTYRMTDVMSGTTLAQTTKSGVFGQYNTTLPTVASGNYNALQIDTKGQLLTDLNYIGGSAVSTAASGVQKVGVVGSTGATLDAATAGGTAPTNGVAVLGVYSATLPSPTGGQAVAIQLDAKGQQLVDLNYVAGSALPSFNGSTSGSALPVNANLYVAGTANASNNPIFVKDSADMTGTVPGTSPSSTLIVGGIYNNLLPIASTGQTMPLQLDQLGYLRVNGSGTFAVQASAVSTDASQSTINITAADVASTSTTWHVQTAITGSPTANSTAAFALTGQTTAILQVSGTLAGTIVFEQSTDGGTTWFAMDVSFIGTNNSATTITGASSPLTNCSVEVSVAAYTNIRVRCTAYTSGTGTVLLRSSNYVGTPQISNSAIFSGTTALTNTSGALNVNVTGGASNTQYVDGSTPGATPTGTVMLGQNGTSVLAVQTDANGYLLPLNPSTSNSGTWNSSTTVNTAITITTSGYTTATLQTTNTGTFLGGTGIFEGQDNAGNWTSVPGYSSGGLTILQSSQSLSLRGVQNYKFDVTGFTAFRMRLVTALTGSGTKYIYLQAQSEGTAPGVFSQMVGAYNATPPVVPGSTTNPNITMLQTNINGALLTQDTAYETDMFNQSVAVPRTSQFEANFSNGADATNITSTTTGSGTITYGSGGVTLATTAATSSGQNLTSVQTLNYRVAAEWFCYFTAKFTTSVANSHQRIGVFNGAVGSPQDGFFIGYEGTTFGISQFIGSTGQGSFSANSSPSIPQNSMNGDTLNGTTSSTFTSSGIQVPWVPTDINLYRMRGGWLGTGVVVLEILSPDANWVVMHTYHFPNTLTQSYTNTTNWNYQAEVLNTTNNTNITMYMGGASFGATSNNYRLSDTMNNLTFGSVTKSGIYGQYNSSAPSLSTSGVFNALQVDSSANLKTGVTSWGGTALGTPTNFGTTPGAVIAGSVNASLFAGTTALTQQGGSLNIFDNTTDNSQATVNITAADVVSTSTTWADGQTAVTGTPTANSAASYSINGEAEFRLQMTGTLVGTIVIEESTDGGTTWFPKSIRLVGTNYVVSTITGASSPLTNFMGHGTAAAVTNVRVRCTAFTSGTGTVLLRSGNFEGSTVVLNPQTLRDATNQANTVGVGPTWGTAYTTNGTLNTNASLFVGTTAAVASAAGVQKVGISGATGVTIDGTTTAGTPPSNGIASLGVYTSNTGTSLSAGQSAAVQLDAGGAVLVDLLRVTNTIIPTTALTSTGALSGTVGVFGAAMLVQNSGATGATVVSPTNPVPVSATGAANTSGNPIFVSAAQSTAANLNATVTNSGGVVSGGTATWTSATSLNTTLVVSTTGNAGLTVFLNQGTTLTGGVVTFEVSDSTGTNWYPISGTIVGTVPDYQYQIYTLTQSTNVAFQFYVAGTNSFRIRLSTAISGTGSVFAGIFLQSFASPTVVSVGNYNGGGLSVSMSGHLGGVVDGVITAATAPANGIVTLGVYNSTTPSLTTGQSAALQLSSIGGLLVQGAQAPAQTFTVSTVSNSTSYSVSNFNIATITLRTFTGTTPSITWQVQASDDNTNWVVLQGINNSTGQVGTAWTQASALTAGTAGPSCDYTIGAYTNLRVAVTAISGTTPSAVFGVDLQTMAYESSPGAICQGLVAAGAAAVGNPVLVGGNVTTAAPSYSTSTVNYLSLTTGGGVRTDNSSWAGTALGTPANFGTTPGAVIAGSVNSSLFVGTTAARSNQTTTAAGVVDVNIVGSLGVTNSATNGTFARITDNTTAITAAVSALGTAPTGTDVMAVNNVALPNASAGAACSLYSAATQTTATVVKASTGNLYGLIVVGTAGNFVQFINVAASPVLGTTALFSIPIPTGGVLTIPPGALAMANFTTGISVGISTTYNGATAGTSAAVVVFYK